MSSEERNISKEFEKIINDFTSDLCVSYPELSEHFNVIDYEAYYNYCKNIYPENFFDILYEHNEIFDKPDCKYLLPNIDFSKIMRDPELSDQSKNTIWKYLQLVLFCVCNNVDNKNDFGDANYLFQAIDEDELHKKIEETMNEMKNIFLGMDASSGDMSGVNDFAESMFGDLSNIFSDQSSDENNQGNDASNDKSSDFFKNMMDADKLKDHLSGIMNGKIGLLAKEIAEEAGKELGIDGENMSEEQQQSFMKGLFKNPTKLLGIVKNIGTKLEEKFKSGDLKESELLEEAQEIMGKMKDIPGLKQMMSSMGLNPGGKFDFKGMANKMQENMRQAKMRERMQNKMKERQNKTNKDDVKMNNKPSGNMTQVQEDTFIWNDDNSKGNEPLQKTSRGSKPNNKKKGKKKGKKN